VNRVARCGSGRIESTQPHVDGDVRTRPSRIILGYALVIVAIVLSFGWQMLHGICPVP
jgi:hypothetical protein